MSQIRLLKVNAKGHYEEHYDDNTSGDSVKFNTYVINDKVLDSTKLTDLLSTLTGGAESDSGALHKHDSQYYEKLEFIDAFGEVGKFPVKLDADGEIDPSLIPSDEAASSQLLHDNLAGTPSEPETALFSNATEGFIEVSGSGVNLITFAFDGVTPPPVVAADSNIRFFLGMAGSYMGVYDDAASTATVLAFDFGVARDEALAMYGTVVPVFEVFLQGAEGVSLANSVAHTKFPLLNGSRDFTAMQQYSGDLSFSADTQMVNKKYVDLKRDQTLAGITGKQAVSLATAVDGSGVGIPLPDCTYTNAWAGAEFKGSWSSVTAYVVDDVVVRNTKTYVCIQGVTNKDPATETAYWELVYSTLEASAVGKLTLDGVDVIAGQRVLIKGQADAEQNGIYQVVTAGAPASSSTQNINPNGTLYSFANGFFTLNFYGIDCGLSIEAAVESGAVVTWIDGSGQQWSVEAASGVSDVTGIESSSGNLILHLDGTLVYRRSGFVQVNFGMYMDYMPPSDFHALNPDGFAYTSGSAGEKFLLARASDFDGTPDGEIKRGSLVYVLGGNTQAMTGWTCISPLGGDGIMQASELGVEEINWAKFSVLTAYEKTAPITISSVNGIPAIGLNIASDKPIYKNLAEEALDFQFNANEMGVNGAHELGLIYGTGNVAKPIKASDLFSQVAGKGVNYVGYEGYNPGTPGSWTAPQSSNILGWVTDHVDVAENLGYPTLEIGTGVQFWGSGSVVAQGTVSYIDVGNMFRVELDPPVTYGGWGPSQISFYTPAVPGQGTSLPADTVKATLDAIAGLISESGYDEYTADGAIAIGDPVYVSANDKVKKYTDLGSDVDVLGVAISGAANAETVQVAKIHKVISVSMSGLTIGDSVYWTGSGYTTSLPTAAGAHIWRLGYVASGTKMTVDCDFVRKNPGPFAGPTMTLLTWGGGQEYPAVTGTSLTVGTPDPESPDFHTFNFRFYGNWGTVVLTRQQMSAGLANGVSVKDDAGVVWTLSHLYLNASTYASLNGETGGLVNSGGSAVTFKKEGVDCTPDQFFAEFAVNNPLTNPWEGFFTVS